MFRFLSLDKGNAWKKSLRALESKFGLEENAKAIIISIVDQKLYYIKNRELVRTYGISSSKYGMGSKENSNKTPLGVHRVYGKIGDGAKILTIFKDKIDTAEVAVLNGEKDKARMITTRILRLEGLEEGINKGQEIDSLERDIYIHGTPDEALISKRASDGCIRMRNMDIIELFDMVPEGTLVKIQL